MASIYVKQGKYWLRYFDPSKNKWRDQATPYYAPKDERKARQLKLEVHLRELKQKGPRQRHTGNWSEWVSEYLKERYELSDNTSKRVQTAWTHLEMFLVKHDIRHPAGWNHEHNMKWVKWAIAEGQHRNTAVWNLGILSMLMNEALRRQYVSENVVSKKNIPRAHVEEKPALTDLEIGRIREALKKAAAGELKSVRGPEARRRAGQLITAFEIALHTGCRLAETSLPFDRINFEKETLTFLPKGGRRGGRLKLYTVPIIFPAFKPWLKDLCDKRAAAGHKTTCDLDISSSRDFARATAHLKIDGLTFHCLRVTFITRAFEAGLDSEVVRKLVHHADALINRIYQRFSIAGLQGLSSRVQLPVVALPEPSTEIASATPKPHSSSVSHLPGEAHRGAK